MDASLKAKWVEALRSGGYQQAASSLIEEAYGERPRRFCCLGVLCDVGGAVWEDATYEQGTLRGEAIRARHGSFLSPEVLTIVGFDDPTQRTLAAMNDSGAPFAVIADYIEANL